MRFTGWNGWRFDDGQLWLLRSWKNHHFEPLQNTRIRALVFELLKGQEAITHRHIACNIYGFIWIHIYIYRYSHTEVFWWCLRHCFKVFKFQCVQVSQYQGSNGILQGQLVQLRLWKPIFACGKDWWCHCTCGRRNRYRWCLVPLLEGECQKDRRHSAEIPISYYLSASRVFQSVTQKPADINKSEQKLCQMYFRTASY